MVEEGHIPKTIIEALENAYKYGNPWGKPKNKRTEWTKGLPEEVKVKDFSQGTRPNFSFYVAARLPSIHESRRSPRPWSSSFTRQESISGSWETKNSVAAMKSGEWGKPVFLKSSWKRI